MMFTEAGQIGIELLYSLSMCFGNFLLDEIHLAHSLGTLKVALGLRQAGIQLQLIQLALLRREGGTIGIRKSGAG